MDPSPRQDFCFAVSLDNGLLRQSVASGEAVPAGEVLSLAAAVQAIYLVITLESRALAHVKDCHRVWTETVRLLDGLCACWADVTCDDPNIVWLRERLEHFRELAMDQTQLYSVSARERLYHSRNRHAEIASYGERNESTPKGWSDQSSPAHVYSVGRF